jgi:putative endonuclease
VLENPSGRFYVGSTGDLLNRVTQHNAALEEGLTYPRKHGPWSLKWGESHPTRADAMAKEKQIKRMKSARWIREHQLGKGGC